MMADPARIKTEDIPEVPISANEENAGVKGEPEDAAASKSSDENKEPDSVEQPKQEQQSVSVDCKICIILVRPFPTCHHISHVNAIAQLIRYSVGRF